MQTWIIEINCLNCTSLFWSSSCTTTATTKIVKTRVKQRSGGHQARMDPSPSNSEPTECNEIDINCTDWTGPATSQLEVPPFVSLRFDGMLSETMPRRNVLGQPPTLHQTLICSFIVVVVVGELVVRCFVTVPWTMENSPCDRDRESLD